MPEGTRVHRCTEHIAAKQGGSKTKPVNAYAACQKSTRQSYATGKPLRGGKKGKR